MRLGRDGGRPGQSNPSRPAGRAASVTAGAPGAAPGSSVTKSQPPSEKGQTPPSHAVEPGVQREKEPRVRRVVGTLFGITCTLAAVACGDQMGHGAVGMRAEQGRTIVEVGLKADLRGRVRPERPSAPQPFPHDADPLQSGLSVGLTAWARLADGRVVSAPAVAGGGFFRVGMAGPSLVSTSRPSDLTNTSARQNHRLEGFRESVRAVVLGHREPLPDAVRWKPLLEALQQVGVQASPAQLDDLLTVVEPTSRLRRALAANG
jgi:hypothetical protein